VTRGNYQAAERLEVGRGEHVFDALSPSCRLPRTGLRYQATAKRTQRRYCSNRLPRESSDTRRKHRGTVESSMASQVGSRCPCGDWEAGLWFVVRRRMDLQATTLRHPSCGRNLGVLLSFSCLCF
jgi:hypothetical protein